MFKLNPFTGEFDLVGKGDSSVTGTPNRFAGFNSAGDLAAISNWEINAFGGVNETISLAQNDSLAAQTDIYNYVSLTLNPNENLVNRGIILNGTASEVSSSNRYSALTVSQNFVNHSGGSSLDWMIGNENYFNIGNNAITSESSRIESYRSIINVFNEHDAQAIYQYTDACNIGASANVDYVTSFDSTVYVEGSVSGDVKGHNFSLSGTSEIPAYYGINGNVSVPKVSNLSFINFISSCELDSSNLINLNIQSEVNSGLNLSNMSYSNAGIAPSGYICGYNVNFDPYDSLDASVLGVAISFQTYNAKYNTFFSGSLQGGESQSTAGVTLNYGSSTVTQYRDGFNLNFGSGVSAFEKGIQINQSTADSYAVYPNSAFYGVSVGGNATGKTRNFVGFEVNSQNSNFTESMIGYQAFLSDSPDSAVPFNRKKTFQGVGGAFENSYTCRTVSSHPFTVDNVNGIATNFIVDSGSPISGTDVSSFGIGDTYSINDDMTFSAFGLGLMSKFARPFLGVESGKTLSKLSIDTNLVILGGAGFGLPNGGTVGEFNYSRNLAPLSIGGSVNFDNIYVFRATTLIGNFSSVATKAYGLFLEDSGFFNWMAGKTLLGRSSYLEPSDTLEVDGNVSLLVAGNGLKIKEGSNARLGTSTLSSGTVTVSNTSVTSNTRVFVSNNAVSGTQGTLSVSINPGTGFTINSSSILDNSEIAWLLVEAS